nr:glycoside hydrolase family 28 protein [uncultured Carboxylicivirga sp.]
MKILKTIYLVLITGLMVACSSKSKDTYPYEYLYKNLPFEMDKVHEPSFPDRGINLTEFGGIGDGVYKNTEAFYNAIESLSGKGGGTLIVSRGVWLTGPIVMKSNINLHLEEGALVLFTRDYDDYPLVETIFEGLDTRRCQSPISGRNLKNIAITGEGCIDGSGDFWRPVKRQKVTASMWKKITSRGGVYKRDDYWFPSPKALHGDTISDMNVPRNLQTDEEWQAVKDFLRPVMVSLIECENVMLRGVCFSNSPSWNLHPLMCKNLIIDNIKVRNPSYAQNGDGLDLESCENALIINSQFDVGDDGICLKSGKDEDGRKRGRPTKNVIVDNCIVYKGHGGFVVGSEMSGGIKNIKVDNCTFLGTDVGLRFKSRRGRGGVVENIFISNITMQGIVTDALTFNLYYGGRSVSEELALADKKGVVNEIEHKVTEETPCFRSLHFKNITSVGSRRSMYFNGLPEMKISDISLENVNMTSVYGAEFNYTEDVKLNNVLLHAKEGLPISFKDSEKLEFNNSTMPEGN